MQAKNPKITIELTPKGIETKLENWTGISGMMLETMQHSIYVAVHQHRAQGLNDLREDGQLNLPRSDTLQVKKETVNVEG